MCIQWWSTFAFGASTCLELSNEAVITKAKGYLVACCGNMVRLSWQSLVCKNRPRWSFSPAHDIFMLTCGAFDETCHMNMKLWINVGFGGSVTDVFSCVNQYQISALLASARIGETLTQKQSLWHDICCFNVNQKPHGHCPSGKKW